MYTSCEIFDLLLEVLNLFVRHGDLGAVEEGRTKARIVLSELSSLEWNVLNSAKVIVAEYFRDSKVEVVWHLVLASFPEPPKLELAEIDCQASNGCQQLLSTFSTTTRYSHKVELNLVICDQFFLPALRSVVF